VGFRTQEQESQVSEPGIQESWVPEIGIWDREYSSRTLTWARIASFVPREIVFFCFSGVAWGGYHVFFVWPGGNVDLEPGRDGNKVEGVDYQFGNVTVLV